MDAFTHALLGLDIAGRRELTLRKGLLLDDVFSSSSMLVVIMSGELEVLCPAGGLANVLASGAVYGISNLFVEDSLASRLRAKSDVSLVLLPKEEVRTAMDADVRLYRLYCALLNRRLDFLFGRVDTLSLKSNRKRVAKCLLDGQAGRFSSREELANYLALGKSALFRELAHLAACGAISYDKDDIRVIDSERLKEVLNA